MVHGSTAYFSRRQNVYSGADDSGVGADVQLQAEGGVEGGGY